MSSNSFETILDKGNVVKKDKLRTYAFLSTFLLLVLLLLVFTNAYLANQAFEESPLIPLYALSFFFWNAVMFSLFLVIVVFISQLFLMLRKYLAVIIISSIGIISWFLLSFLH